MYIERNEIEILNEKLRLAIEQNAGSTVFISGDAGTGKSTLIDRFLELCDESYEQNVLTGSGYCFDMDGVTRGFLPWKEVLIELDADKNAGKDQEKKNDFKKIVKTIFDKSGPEWFQNIPAVGEISAAILETAKAMKKTESIDIKSGKVKELSFKERLRNAFSYSAAAWLGAIPIVGGFAEAIFKTSTKLMEDSKDMQLKNREGFFVLVDEKLRDLARENPIVVFLDNLQWADNSSLSLLYYLSRKMTDNPFPMLLIGSFRPREIKEGRFNEVTGSTERHPFEEKLNNLQRYNAAETINLVSFSRKQVENFINSNFENNLFDAGFVEELYNLTKGNPLFLDEIMKNFTETGVIYKNDSGQFTSKEIDFINMPKSVTAIIKERFDRLPVELREFLQVASVQGEMFNTEIISSIQNEPPLKAIQKNDRLMNEFNLVEQSHKISESLGDMYQFTHHLVQNYIYNEMSLDYRLNIHKLVAEEYRDISNVEVMLQFIFHYGVGHRIIDNKRNLIIGKDNFEAEKVNTFLNAQKNVANLYINSFNSDEALNMTSEIMALAEIVDDKKLLVNYLVKQGEIHQLTGKWEDAMEVYRKAVTNARELKDKESIVQSSKALSEMLRLKAKARERSGKWNKARDLYLEAVQLAENTNEIMLIANARKNLSWILVLLGNYSDAMEECRHLHELFNSMGNEEDKIAGINSLHAILKKYKQVAEDIGEQEGVNIINGFINEISGQ